ncbi:unnamed protein product, partial [Rotaria socialis]
LLVVAVEPTPSNSLSSISPSENDDEEEDEYGTMELDRNPRVDKILRKRNCWYFNL